MEYYYYIFIFHFIICLANSFCTEDEDISNAKLTIFASKPITNNSKIIEVPLVKSDNGMWIYELPRTSLNDDNNFEYWLYGEKSGMGYFTHNAYKLRDLDIYEPSELESSMQKILKPMKDLYPNVRVKLLRNDSLQFYFQEQDSAYDDIKIILFSPKSLINNDKFIENSLRRDTNGLWIYEMQNISLKFNDVIEFSIYAVKSNIGFFDSKTIRVEDIKDEVLNEQPPELVPIITTYPKVEVKIEGTRTIHFSIQETYIAYSVIKISLFSPKILISDNLKFIEIPLIKDDDGLWSYEIQTNVSLKRHDIIDYWIYAEIRNFGFYSNGIFKVQDIAPTFIEESMITTTTTTEAPIINCEVSVSTVNGNPVKCKNNIIFNEDFNSDNLKYWNFDTRYPLDDSIAEAEFVVYEKRKETHFILDNVLNLKAESLLSLGFTEKDIRQGEYNLNNKICTPLKNDTIECNRKGMYGHILPPVSSSYLSTRNKFSFKYGRVKARVRGPIGDWLYGQITIQPQPTLTDNSNVTAQHLKLFFGRGNDYLKNLTEEVGGETIFGGAMLSKNPKNNQKWLKRMKLKNAHAGKNFHIYELLWTPSKISVFVDDEEYGSLNSNFRQDALNTKIEAAKNWGNNGPFDKEHFLAINLAAGGVKYFYSQPNPLKNGKAYKTKPWNDTDPKALFNFYKNKKEWYESWTKPSLEVDYIRIYAV